MLFPFSKCFSSIFQKHLHFNSITSKVCRFWSQNKWRSAFLKHISINFKDCRLFWVPKPYAGFDLETQDRSSFRTYYIAPLPERLLFSTGPLVAWESERSSSSTRPASNLRRLSTIASTFFSNSSSVLANM